MKIQICFQIFVVYDGNESSLIFVVGKIDASFKAQHFKNASIPI